MRTKNSKILFIIQLPPPIHGVTMMNKYITESKKLAYDFHLGIIPLNFNTTLEHLGKFSFLKGWKLIKSLTNLFYKLLFNKIDLVYFTLTPTKSTFLRDLLYVSLIKLFRVKHVFHIHGKGIQESIAKNKYLEKIYKYTFKNANVICLSKLLTYDLDRIYSGTPYILANGIPSTHELETIDFTSKNFDLLFFSNFARAKGILEFIEIVDVIKQHGFNIKAAIGGSKQDFSKEELTEIIRNKGLDNCLSVLETSNDFEKNELFARSKIFVFPTQNEAFGLVILEAMQAALPVISSLEGAIPDLVKSGYSGYLLDKNDVSSFIERTEELLLSPEKAIAMGRAGFDTYKEFFRLEIFENNLVTILKSILNEPPR